MKQHKISLAVKLDILIVTVIVFVTITLMEIGYGAYQQRYVSMMKNLSTYSEDLKEKSESYVPVMKYISGYFSTEEFRRLSSRISSIEDPDDQIDMMDDWMSRIPSMSGDSTLAYDYVVFLGKIFDLCRDYSVDAAVAVAETGDGWIELGREERLHTLMSYMSTDHTGVPAEKTYYGTNPMSPALAKRPEGWEIASYVPMNEEGFTGGIWLCYDVTNNIHERDVYVRTCILSVLALTGIVIAVARTILKKMATEPLKQLAEAACGFAADDRGCTRDDVISLDIRSNDEIGDLYREIRTMENHIVDYTENLTRITAEKERIRTEMDLAATIQESALPHRFPPFPERPEFDLYASMDAAREVGGDFYDFFLIDDDHLVLVIADVSGKGVPAALFMMTSRQILKYSAMTGKTAAQILSEANNVIFRDNQADMFVTVWLGILEISTGTLTAASAGHEYPAIFRADSGTFELLRDKHGPVIGFMEDIHFPEYRLLLRPGDRLFVYTDGVPEAADFEGNMFGTGRMIDALNQLPDAGCAKLVSGMSEAISAFVRDAEQFDDITMLCLEYRGQTEPADSHF